MEWDINTIDITESLRRASGKVLYRGEEGQIVLDRETIMTDIDDVSLVCDQLVKLGVRECCQLTTKNFAVGCALRDMFGLSKCNSCIQAVYTQEVGPDLPDCDIRPLMDQHISAVAAQYHPEENYGDYIAERIEKGLMWGLFDQGTLAGFIGIHSEGSMGLLEIFPEFRRRGYAYYLEAFIINWQLAQGWIPFCHVIRDNSASLSLQKKLGLEFAPKPTFWVD